MNYTQTYLEDLNTVCNIQHVENLSNISILLTGATGQIGSCLADFLLYLNSFFGQKLKLTIAGRNEETLHNRLSYWEESAYSYLSYDATKLTYFNHQYDFVIHCASNAHPSAYINEPAETMEANLIGVLSLLKHAAKGGIGRLLYVSSSEVYGQRDSLELFSEQDYQYVDILSPRSCYPSAKRAAETLCASYCSEYDVDFVAVRPGHIYGPTMSDSDSRAHAQFARSAVCGEDIILKSTGEQLRSYCYVVDCVTAILTVLLEGKKGDAYNISNRDSIVTVREMAEAFAKAGGVQVKFDAPTEEEKKGYNPMSCSALNSEKLELLGWRGSFNIFNGAKRTISILRSSIND